MQGVEGQHEVGAARPSGCVLVVEDDPLVRRVVVRLLVSWGYDPVEAADGPDAVDRFRERRDRLDVVLLDLMLPRMDGIGVARAIRSEDAALPIVICSAALNRGVREELRGLNVQGYLDKPVTADCLRSTLAATLKAAGPRSRGH